MTIPSDEESLQAYLESLSRRVVASDEALRRAQAGEKGALEQLQVEKGTVQELRNQLAQANEQRASSAAEASAAKAEAAGLRDQLKAERAAREQVSAQLDRAIASLKTPTQGKPPSYEIVVQARDGNERLRHAVLRPMEEKR